jgi:integrase
MTGAEAGVILSRSRRRYKPSALRSYRQAPELRVLPDFGAHPLADLRRAEWQRLVNRLHAAGNAASTIRNTLDPVRAVYRWLQSLDEIQVNPTRGLEFPAGSRRRDRVAAPAEGAALLAALTFPEKGIYATAMYAGARRGELQALEDKNVDLDSNEIRVEWGWDEVGRPHRGGDRGRRAHIADPKGARANSPRTPHAPRLGDGLLFFGRLADRPFVPSTIRPTRPRRVGSAGSAAPADRIHIARRCSVRCSGGAR